MIMGNTMKTNNINMDGEIRIHGVAAAPLRDFPDFPARLMTYHLSAPFS
jgi:hypothetical protein